MKRKYYVDEQIGVLRQAEARTLVSEVCRKPMSGHGPSIDLAISGYLFPKDAKALVDQALSRIWNIRADTDLNNGHTKVEIEKLDALEMKWGNFKARRSRPLLGDIRDSEVITYRKVFQTLAEVSESPHAAKEMIEAILSYTHARGSSNIAVPSSRASSSRSHQKKESKRGKNP